MSIISVRDYKNNEKQKKDRKEQKGDASYGERLRA